jgi:hypothetical protein
MGDCPSFADAQPPPISYFTSWNCAGGQQIASKRLVRLCGVAGAAGGKSAAGAAVRRAVRLRDICDLTSQATLRNWSTLLSVADIFWGSVLAAISALIGYLVAQRLGAGA